MLWEEICLFHFQMTLRKNVSFLIASLFIQSSELYRTLAKKITTVTNYQTSNHTVISKIN